MQLQPGYVLYVEHIDRLDTVGRDHRTRYHHVRPVQRVGKVVDETRAVPRVDLNDRMDVRTFIVEGDFRRNPETQFAPCSRLALAFPVPGPQRRSGVDFAPIVLSIIS